MHHIPEFIAHGWHGPSCVILLMVYWNIVMTWTGMHCMGLLRLIRCEYGAIDECGSSEVLHAKVGLIFLISRPLFSPPPRGPCSLLGWGGGCEGGTHVCKIKPFGRERERWKPRVITRYRHSICRPDCHLVHRLPCNQRRQSWEEVVEYNLGPLGLD